MNRNALGLMAALFLAGCASPKHQEHQAAGGPRRLGNHTFPITTASPAAQKAFDRGLIWTFAFAHHAAQTEFQRAAELDPNCAMAYWGIALINGPHINFPMVPEPRAKAAWEALNRARELAPRGNRLEQALIRALEKRYAWPQPEDRSGLDMAYAEAMAEVWREFPDNADVGALYAEAEMDLHPWDLWKEGAPQPWTENIVRTLERVLELNPRHPGANHYYIHAVEASNTPERALAAARRLDRLVPDSSHLVHMPSHIYARVGLWAEAARSNERAMRADARYRQAYPRPGFYALYMAHNTHFLAFTAMMRGRSEEAIRLAREMVAAIPPEFIREYAGVVDGFTVFVPEVLMRFGRWEEILNEPAPPDGLPLARAKWHFTRATALTVLNRFDEAHRERRAFTEAAARIPETSTFGNNSARDLAAIAALVLDGRCRPKRATWLRPSPGWSRQSSWRTSCATTNRPTGSNLSGIPWELFSCGRANPKRPNRCIGTIWPGCLKTVGRCWALARRSAPSRNWRRHRGFRHGSNKPGRQPT